MNRTILVKMPDKSVWAVLHRPLAEIVADRQLQHGAWEKGTTKDQVVAELLEANIIDVAADQLLEWLDWPDIVPHALMVKPPDPPYADWWKKWDQQQRPIEHWQDFWFLSEADKPYLTTHGFSVSLQADGALTISKTTKTGAWEDIS